MALRQYKTLSVQSVDPHKVAHRVCITVAAQFLAPFAHP